MKRDSLSLNPNLKIFEVSCKTGQGITEWTNWVQTLMK
jgi:hydrogenase nickel incorporation protein HypB